MACRRQRHRRIRPATAEPGRRRHAVQMRAGPQRFGQFDHFIARRRTDHHDSRQVDAS